MTRTAHAALASAAAVIAVVAMVSYADKPGATELRGRYHVRTVASGLADLFSEEKSECAGASTVVCLLCMLTTR